MNDVLIVRGAPGVGKSSVGALLAKHYKGGVTIEIDEVRRMINAVTWSGVKEHLDAISASAGLLTSYLKSNYRPIIIIDTLSHGTIKFILRELPSKSQYKIFSLFAQEEIIKERIAKRNSGFMDLTISLKTNTAIINEQLQNNYAIDTSNLSIQDTFNEIIKML